MYSKNIRYKKKATKEAYFYVPISEHRVPASSSFRQTFNTDVIMIYQFTKSDIRQKFLKKKDCECHFLSVSLQWWTVWVLKARVKNRWAQRFTPVCLYVACKEKSCVPGCESFPFSWHLSNIGAGEKRTIQWVGKKKNCWRSLSHLCCFLATKALKTRQQTADGKSKGPAWRRWW